MDPEVVELVELYSGGQPLLSQNDWIFRDVTKFTISRDGKKCCLDKLKNKLSFLQEFILTKSDVDDFFCKLYMLISLEDITKFDFLDYRCGMTVLKLMEHLSKVEMNASVELYLLNDILLKCKKYDRLDNLVIEKFMKDQNML